MKISLKIFCFCLPLLFFTKLYAYYGLAYCYHWNDILHATFDYNLTAAWSDSSESDAVAQAEAACKESIDWPSSHSHSSYTKGFDVPFNYWVCAAMNTAIPQDYGFGAGSTKDEALFNSGQGIFAKYRCWTNGEIKIETAISQGNLQKTTSESLRS